MAEVSPSELTVAQEFYIRYATGVAIINDPERLQPLLSMPIEIAHQEPILVHAEKLMIDGLQNMIRYAHPNTERSYLAPLEHEFDRASQPLRQIVRTSYEEHAIRLEGLNRVLPFVQPNPLTDRIIYGYICRSRLHKLTVERLMGGMGVSPFFEGSTVDQSLIGVSPRLRGIPRSA